MIWQVLVSFSLAHATRERLTLRVPSNRYKDTQGSLFYNPNQLNGQVVYAAAYMVQSSPSMICPYYNATAGYRSSTGLAYFVVCGGQYLNGVDMGSATPNSEFERCRQKLIRGVLTLNQVSLRA